MRTGGDGGDILLGELGGLGDVVSRDALSSIAGSFFSLFGLPVRVISQEGDLLADVHRDQPLCSYVNTLVEGARQCESTVCAVRDREPEDRSVVHPCFTGAVYRVVPLGYQGRPIGRFVIGPYVPAEAEAPPASLFAVDPNLSPATAREHHERMPRVREDIAKLLCDHLQVVIELLVFSGHRAQLASTMQIASVRENYRELAEKNEALEASHEELKQLSKLKSTFLATVSHELRTPLTSIIGYAEMLESGATGGLTDEQRGFVETIRTKADDLLGLIGSLLDLGRLETESLKLRKEPVNAGTLLAAISSTILPAARARRIALETEVAPGTPRIWGDPIRLRQIVLNLVDNALKFSAEGSTVRVDASPSQLDVEGPSLFTSSRSGVAITVADEGIGIDESQLSKIFDAFYQVDSGTTRAHGGAGLGLSIVKQLVDGHQGTIQATSGLGQGTLFTVTLPAECDA